MEPFTRVRGRAAPMPAANIDTDVIMPKVFLKGVDRSGLAEGVFHDLRFGPDGVPDPDFILNRPGWTGAAFLVVGPNFGCGSSREHAVWGLRQLGIRALIGTTYAGIFFDNCARNGLLALTLEPGTVGRLQALAADPDRNGMTVDLADQVICTEDGNVAFAIEPLRKAMLLEGLDAVGATLKRADEIRAFQQDHHERQPWLRPGRPTAANSVR